MPRKKITLDNTIDSLSILDEKGKVDKKLEPKLSKDDLLKLFRAMTLARRYDERMLKLQRQGRIGTYGPALGQEAASLGPAFAIEESDWYVPSFREPAGMLYRGWPMARLMLWWGGNEIGATPLAKMNDMPISVPVASQIQYGAGIAWGLKLDGGDRVAVAFVGDGGTSEGDFHEGLNCAATFGLPLVVVIQNNHWAISLPRHKQSASKTLAQKAIAYGIDGIQTDGNDILAMVEATREAVEKARKGGGPTLIEAVTYRMGVHTTADDPTKYRKDEEVEPWKPKDPLVRFWKYISDKGVLDEAGREKMEAEITDEIAEAVQASESYEPNLMEPFDHCFAERTPALEQQRAQFEAYLNGNGNGKASGSASVSHSAVH